MKKLSIGLMVAVFLFAMVMPAMAGGFRVVVGIGGGHGGYNRVHMGFAAPRHTMPMPPAGYGYNDGAYNYNGANGYNYNGNGGYYGGGYNGNYNADFERGYREVQEQRRQERENAAYECGRRGERCQIYSAGEEQAYERGLNDFRNEMIEKDRQRAYEAGRQQGQYGYGQGYYGR